MNFRNGVFSQPDPELTFNPPDFPGVFGLLSSSFQDVPPVMKSIEGGLGCGGGVRNLYTGKARNIAPLSGSAGFELSKLLLSAYGKKYPLYMNVVNAL